LIDLLDYYAAGWPYLFIAFTEVLVVGHIYGLNRFLDNLESMSGWRPRGYASNAHVAVLYLTLTPLIIAVNDGLMLENY